MTKTQAIANLLNERIPVAKEGDIDFAFFARGGKLFLEIAPTSNGQLIQLPIGEKKAETLAKAVGFPIE